MQRPFFIRHEVLPDVNCQLRGFDDDVDVFSQMISPVHLFSVFQGDLVQEALAVTFAKDQTQALNIPIKVPLGGGRYAELTEWNGNKRVDLRIWERVWSLANVTAKASCTRSSWVRVNGMFNALFWSFAFDLRDMSNEV
jgi:hypothetical protein